MKVLLDTSVLVAGMVEAHPQHERAFIWLKQAVDKKIEGVVSAHTLAELYSVLTVLPLRPPISSADAVLLIRENVLAHFEVISLTGQEYGNLIEHLASQGISGGATYDGVILWAAKKAKVDWVVTFNVKDFRRLSGIMAKKVVSPDVRV